jgi:hypothetical protein
LGAAGEDVDEVRPHAFEFAARWVPGTRPWMTAMGGHPRWRNVAVVRRALTSGEYGALAATTPLLLPKSGGACDEGFSRQQRD